LKESKRRRVGIRERNNGKEGEKAKEWTEGTKWFKKDEKNEVKQGRRQ
jgi:hypothetical protein